MYRNRNLYILLLAFIFLMAGCEKGEALNADVLINKDFNNLKLDNLNEYKIDVDLNEAQKLFTAKQYTTYVNNTEKTLDEVYFHIYPNAFRTLDKAPILFNQEYEDPLSYKGGYIDIVKITINQKEVKYSILEEDTILNIKLDKALLKGEKTVIYFEYIVKFPNAKDRFGYGNRVINCGNWYPIACVYDKDGWNLDPYYKLGDPFYSDIANYKVNITIDQEMIIASSGKVLEEKLSNNRKTYIIEGQLIRDFAWVGSYDFKIKEILVEDTLVKLYYLDENTAMVNHSIEVGKKAIKIFNELFGKYPYGQYSIVMTEFPSGMEYPGIVFISDEYFFYSAKRILEQIIVHETAHQWWYGLVGSDQIDEAWLDEGLTTYSEVIYIKKSQGKDAAEKYFIDNIKTGYDYGVKYLGRDQIVNKPLKEFISWNDYGVLVYTKGAMFINVIEKDFGEEVLYEILRTYFNKYKFYNATTEDFVNICEEVTKMSFDDLVKSWLY